MRVFDEDDVAELPSGTLLCEKHATRWSAANKAIKAELIAAQEDRHKAEARLGVAQDLAVKMLRSIESGSRPIDSTLEAWKQTLANLSKAAGDQSNELQAQLAAALNRIPCTCEELSYHGYRGSCSGCEFKANLPDAVKTFKISVIDECIDMLDNDFSRSITNRWEAVEALQPLKDKKAGR